MKKTFIFLSILFASTYAQEGESGSTEPFTPEDYLELVHNPHSEKIEPYEWKDKTPDIKESNKHPNGFDGIPRNCYEEKIPSFCNDPTDTDTPEKNKRPIIYLSIQKGKTAHFLLQMGSALEEIYPYEDLCLLQEKKYTKTESKPEDIKLENIYSTEDEKKLNLLNDGINISVKEPAEACTNKQKRPVNIKKITGSDNHEVSIDINEIENGGVYTLWGKSSISDIRGDWNKVLNIHILPYEPEIKEFVYIQLDGDDKDREDWDPQKEDPENSYTEQKALDYFNEVYKQAVVKAQITIGKDGDKDLVIDENTTINKDVIKEKRFKLSGLGLIEVDLTNENQSDATNIMLAYAIEYFANYGDPKDPKSKYFHIVFAINKERKKWNLESCIDKKTKFIDLTTCNGFNELKTQYILENDAKGTQYNILRKGTKIPVKIKKSKINNHYYVFKSDENELMPYMEKDILYTDNGFPAIPGDTGVVGVSRDWSEELLKIVEARMKELKKIDSKKDYLSEDNYSFKKYLPYGSIIFVTRSNGVSGKYTLAHELGHSFGLTDVAPITQDIEKGNGTTERNLMTWVSPSGPKISYRNAPIACTKGKTYIFKLKYNEKNEPCTKGKTCKEFPYKTSNNSLNGKGENQWECFRNCFTDEFLTPNRFKYWKKTVPDLDKYFKKNLTKKEYNELPSEWKVKNECSTEEETIDLSTYMPDTRISLEKKIEFLMPKLTKKDLVYILKFYKYTPKQIKNYFTIEELLEYYTIAELKKCKCYTKDELSSYL